jgi:flagellar hook-associated protein 3 FlgL
MNYNQVKTSIEKNRSEVADLQNQASTMKRITKPSDDPIGTARTLAIRTDKVGTEQFLKNIDQAKTFLNFTESSLGDLSEIFMRAKELAISQASDASSNAVTRMATSTEIDQMYKDVVGISNRRFGERYLFGGYKTTQSPFDGDGNYKGDDGSMRVEVNKGTYTPMNMPGSRVFLGKNYALGLVPENKRGATTPHYPASPSLEGEKQQEPIDVRNPASVERGFDENKNPEASQFTNSEAQLGAQGENLFNVLRTLSNGLRANDTVAVQETLERIDSALDQVVTLRSQVGSRLNSLSTTAESLAKSKVDNSALLSSIEDADAFEVFTDITKDENTLKATLQTSGKLIQPSLLDFLR